MLLKQSILRGIVDGSITLQFRRWKRPTVKAGGTLLTSAGQLSIEAVDPVDVDGVTKSEAAAAGFESLDALRAALRRGSGQAYRIRLSLLGPDPRVALRRRPPSAKDTREILGRLERLDARSKGNAWTLPTLRLIRDRQGERAAELAEALDLDRAVFKTRVRKLKQLGLTESLEVGYRLSPRGHEVLRAAEATSADP